MIAIAVVDVVHGGGRGIVHGIQPAVAKIDVATAGDAGGVEVRHEGTLALKQTSLVGRKASVSSFRHQLLRPRIVNLLDGAETTGARLGHAVGAVAQVLAVGNHLSGRLVDGQLVRILTMTETVTR